MIHFNKFFKIPGPKDLGMSHSNNAMPSEDFKNNNTEFTWEQYYARVKKEYPIKYFFAHTLIDFVIYNIWFAITRPLSNFIYWFKCHTLPSYKYHMLDLRQPKNVKDKYPYRYGWRDTDTRMEYALFNLLVEFVEREVPKGFYVPSEEEVAKDDGIDCQYSGLKNQYNTYKEFMEIYKFWTEDRFKLEELHDELLHVWSELRKTSVADDPKLQKAWASLNEIDEIKDEAMDQMMIRLIKIRSCLWT